MMMNRWAGSRNPLPVYKGGDIRDFPVHEMVLRDIRENSPLQWSTLIMMTGLPVVNTREAVDDLIDCDMVAVTTKGLVAL